MPSCAVAPAGATVATPLPPGLPEDRRVLSRIGTGGDLEAGAANGQGLVGDRCVAACGAPGSDPGRRAGSESGRDPDNLDVGLDAGGGWTGPIRTLDRPFDARSPSMLALRLPLAAASVPETLRPAQRLKRLSPGSEQATSRLVQVVQQRIVAPEPAQCGVLATRPGSPQVAQPLAGTREPTHHERPDEQERRDDGRWRQRPGRGCPVNLGNDALPGDGIIRWWGQVIGARLRGVAGWRYLLPPRSWSKPTQLRADLPTTPSTGSSPPLQHRSCRRSRSALRLRVSILTDCVGSGDPKRAAARRATRIT